MGLELGGWALVGSLALAGAGCGLDTIGYPDGLPQAAVLELSFSQVKQFDFSWTAVAADSYQLWESPDVDQPYVQVGADIAADSVAISHIMPLHLRANASYVLKACNSKGCTDSEPVQVMGSMAEAVGYFKASNTDAEDWFGLTIALSADGDTLAVGATQEDSSAVGIDGAQGDDLAADSGAVYVFKRAGATWSQQAYVKASNTGAGDRFGGSIALSADGDTMAVGARWEDSSARGVGGDPADNPTTDESGAVYVFKRAGEAWSQQAYVKASNTAEGDWFGNSVALSAKGDILAVGASQEAETEGAVYVFKFDQMQWSEQKYLKASNPGPFAAFGSSVALSADGYTLAASAVWESNSATGIDGAQDLGVLGKAGAVYVFGRTGDEWTQESYVKASNTGEDDEFGGRIALSADGSTLAVGANGESSGASGVAGDQSDDSAPNAGAVYVFTRGSGTWAQQAYLKASNPREDNFFGLSLALSEHGEVLAVGAFKEDSDARGVGGDQGDISAVESGAAYVFKRAGDAWSQQAYVKAPNTDAGDLFGFSVALSGDGNTLAAGAYYERSGATGVGGDQGDVSVVNAGAVYLY